MSDFNLKKLKFSCQRCSSCCRINPGFVYLSLCDLTNLCNYFKLDSITFIEKYCRWVSSNDGDYYLCLLEKENNDCIFWAEGGCKVYQVRPVQCSTFPFWSYYLESTQRWNECSKLCPGINKGNLHYAEEIAAELKKYEDNHPLKRSEYIKM